MMSNKIHVLALGKYGELAASSRQRMVQYLRPLEELGIILNFEPLLPDSYVEALAHSRGGQSGVILQSYLRRVRRLLSVRDFDLVWVHCDLLPYVPGSLEMCFLSADTPIVYDCDDAIFHNYDLHRNALVRRLLSRKLEPLLRRCRAGTCGNDYLKAYVEQFCAGSVVVPTVVDTQRYLMRTEAAVQTSSPVKIGWIGSPSTWAYVKPLFAILEDLKAQTQITFHAIGVGEKDRTNAEFEFVDWALETEVSEIQKLDVGIMPLTDDPWSRGKCGFKLIQYMACGLPVVASPVGVNRKLVKHGENGFLASTEQEWISALSTLIAEPALRTRMGAAGRALVEREYSLQSQVPRVADILRSAVS